MDHPLPYRWYDAFEKGRTHASLKGDPGAPCRATTEVLQNTRITFLPNNLSIVLHELKNAPQVLLYRLTQMIVTKKLSFS